MTFVGAKVVRTGGIVLRPYLVGCGCNAIALVAALLLFGEGGAGGFADDPGVGWHLQTGKLIRQTGMVPSSDPFLFASEPRAWIADQWLSDVVLSILHELGSWHLLYICLGGIFFTTFFVLGQGMASQWSRSPLAASFAALLALKLSTIHFILRPVIFAFLLFALVCAFCFESVSMSRVGRALPRKRVLGLPPLFLVWANLHPSFVVGLLLLALTTLSLVYDSTFIEHSRAGLRNAGILALVTLVSAAVTLINPYGYDLHGQIMNLTSSSFFMSLNTEWLPINLRSGAGRLLEAVALILFSGAVVSQGRKQSWGFFECAVFGVFLHLSLTSVRFLPFFAIASLPLVASSLSLWAEIFARRLRIGGVGRSKPPQPPTFKRRGTEEPVADETGGSVVQVRTSGCRESEQSLEMMGDRMSIRGRYGYLAEGSLVVFLVVSFLIAHAVGFGPRGLVATQPGPNVEVYPYGAMDFLRSHAKGQGESEAVVVAATPDWGGFVTWYGAPRIKAVIDDRNSLLGEQFYRRFLGAMKDGELMVSTARALGATYVLVVSNDPLCHQLKSVEGVELVYQDAVASAFHVISTEGDSSTVSGGG